MVPKQIVVSVGKTVNIGNYESIRIDASITANVEPDEIKKAFDAAWKMAEEQVKQKLEEIDDHTFLRID